MSTKARIKQAAARLTQADAAVTDEFGEHGDNMPVRALATVGELGDQPQLRLIGCATFAAGLLRRNRRLTRAGVRMLVAHELATFAKNFVKRRVDRTRPRSADTRNQAKPRRGRSEGKEATSFPSGHTAGAVAAARAFAREFPEHRAPALAAAGVVALAQIPRCAHYPTDVGAGALIGGAAEAALARLWPASPSEPEGPDQATSPGSPPR